MAPIIHLKKKKENGTDKKMKIAIIRNGITNSLYNMNMKGNSNPPLFSTFFDV